MSREHDVFNASFVAAWKKTNNYSTWLSNGPYFSLEEVAPGHPHAGTLSMSDMKIRLSQ